MMAVCHTVVPERVGTMKDSAMSSRDDQSREEEGIM